MRWFGFTDDDTPGGTTLDDLQAVAGDSAIPVPDTFVPVVSAQVDPGVNPLDRDDEVRGRRANVAPASFASAPSLSVEARAYPKFVRSLIRRALGGAINSTGVAPAAITSTVGPLQEGNLPTLIGWLVREGQIDRLTGLAVGEVELNFAVDEEGRVTSTLPALYHDAADAGEALEDPNGEPGEAIPEAAYPDYLDTFMLRDAIAYRGAGAGVEVPNFAGFGFTFNNGLQDDFRSRFRPRHNIEVVSIDGVQHKLWYPERHKIGPQTVTGRVDFSDVDPDSEARRLVQHAEKLVFEVAAGRLGTTPDADEMLRLTMYKQAVTGGGPEPLTREGDQVSSYEFSAYLETDGVNAGKDVEATFVGAAALT